MAPHNDRFYLPIESHLFYNFIIENQTAEAAGMSFSYSMPSSTTQRRLDFSNYKSQKEEREEKLTTK